MPSLVIGLDRLIHSDFEAIRGRRIGVVCNQASVDSQFRHILEVLEPGRQSGEFDICAVFGPQHGLFGHTQDNMIEWDGKTGPQPYAVHSLYGEHREPTDAMLTGLNLLLIDLPDVGARYYTFIWTISLCIKAAARLGIPVLVLDRPNPINGVMREAPVQDRNYLSFVGLHPVPIRHGMTVGEIARHVQQTEYPQAQIEVLEVQNWDRSTYADTNGYAWVMPSPNMPTVDTAVVYPGGCLLEATNLSEGRGTTRPFETLGAPWLNGAALAKSLNDLELGGCYFRPVQFEPTFNKYGGQLCEGVFVHVQDRTVFAPVFTYIAILQEVVRQTGTHDSRHVKLDRFKATSGETDLPGFAWKQPPYEYEYEKLPIDILAGGPWMRESVESLIPLQDVRQMLAP